MLLFSSVLNLLALINLSRMQNYEGGINERVINPKAPGMIFEPEIERDYQSKVLEVLKLAGAENHVEFEPAGEGLRGLLESWDGQKDLLDMFLVYINCEIEGHRLFISAASDDKYKNYCLTLVSHAMWGCCISEAIAIDYSEPKSRLVNQLHETLHLFGVDDCYNLPGFNPKSSCDDSACVMRHGSSSVGVCSSVIEQLQRKFL
ncbi:MAG: hypothetical protein V7699_01610 [Porticoccus sp.]